LLLVEGRQRQRLDCALWIVDYCGGCSRFLVATRSRPAFAHPPGPRICGRSPIAASWIAGLLDPPPTSEVPRLTQPPPRSIHSPASARRAFNAFKRVASPKTTDGEKTHSAAPHTTAPVQSTPDWRNWKKVVFNPPDQASPGLEVTDARAPTGPHLDWRIAAARRRVPAHPAAAWSHTIQSFANQPKQLLTS
jgi:hypothetical protein